MVTDEIRFYEGNEPKSLLARFGSPLYVYNERVFRERCRDIVEMCKYSRYEPHYSVKANTNLTLMRIAREEGLRADAMSEGEIRVGLAAGFAPSDIFFVPNNIGDDEMKFGIDNGVTMSADSLSQLERFGRLNRGGEVAFRLNPGVGDGHHVKVVTAGDGTKFGIDLSDVDEVKRVAERYDLTIVGINQHIGSGFMEPSIYMKAVGVLLDAALGFPDLRFVDLGGGFGIPYRKAGGEVGADLAAFGRVIDEAAIDFTRRYGREIAFKTEPGRYVCAEAGLLLGTVNAVKNVGSARYVGTDMGFGALCRVAMYGSWHDIEVYGGDVKTEVVTVTGDICESGDVLAEDRELPVAREGCAVAVLDAGAYGFSMASNYNTRPRPAEVLIDAAGGVRVIRRRDGYDEMLRNMMPL